MKEIAHVSNEALANLSIDELEWRLEMQIIALPDADWCISKGCTCNGQYNPRSS